FQSVVQKLRKEDLITQDRKKKIWQVTQKGKEKLLQLIKQRGSCPKKYVAKISDEVVIVSFDVPEKNRTKRNWLRHVLKEMNFTMIQKSVWLAKLRLPKEFIEDLRLFKLLPCVQIFSVNKSGTIENIA
ncbi:MAG: CRISPR-associated endonuclease Cas2, partial [bacterium]|nr:CRISPR-associated endonuclease Cas2 [bacterium]